MIRSVMKCGVHFVAMVPIGMAAASPAWAQGETSHPLPQAHAHNDYEHERPLFDALAHGFCSIEADIHLRDGQILVAHDPEDVQRDRTLEALYLKPLSERVEQNSGRVYRDGPTVTLLIDIKTGGEETYRSLRPLLEKYRNMLTRFASGLVHEGAVTVVISGNRPKDLIAAEEERLVGIDGRATDISSAEDLPSDLVPLISDNWTLQFSWRGEGEMPSRERQKLDRLVRRAHDEGRRVRFWATPENENLWKTLRDAGVDLIGTDDLERLAAFLR